MSGPSGHAVVTRSAFDRLAPQYDRLTSADVFQHQRHVSHLALARWLPPGCRVLEIGCGTGVDTAFLARRALHVIACDPSEAMVCRTLARLASAGLAGRAQVLACGLDDLPALLGTQDRPVEFDAIVSNFGALNCVPSLDRLGALARDYLRPGGRVVTGLLGRTCAWESVYFALTGRAGLAARRRQPSPVSIPVAGLDVPTYYHRPQDVTRALGSRFTLEGRVGLAVFVPPPYLEPRWQQLPRVLRRVTAHADRLVASWPLVNRLGDHVLLCWTRRRDRHV